MSPLFRKLVQPFSNKKQGLKRNFDLDGIVTTSNLVLWLRADHGVVLDTSGGVTTLSQWQDQSGNGNHAYQTTKTRQPSFFIEPGGRQTIKFDGVSTYLTTDAINLTNGLTFFVVFKTFTDTFSDWNGIITSRNNFSDKTSNSGFGSGLTGRANQNKVISDISTNLQSTRLNKVDVNLTDYQNWQVGVSLGAGIQILSQKQNIGSSYAYFTIGADVYSAARILNGWISDILMYDTRLPSTDMTNVENLLLP